VPVSDTTGLAVQVAFVVAAWTTAVMPQLTSSTARIANRARFIGVSYLLAPWNSG
jgi:hypothetical protein